MHRPHLIAWLLLALIPVTAAAAEPVFLGKPVSRWLVELRDPNPRVRQNAAFALGKIGGQTHEAMGGFAGAPAARAAVETLSQSHEVIAALLRALEDRDDARVRDAAAYALGEMGPSLWPGDVVARLREVLTADAEARVRRSAAFALGQNGERALPAREALLTALRDADAGVRQSAALALGQLGRSAGGPVITALSGAVIRDPDAEARRDAARALGAIGRPIDRSARAALLDRLARDDSPVVRAAALAALVNTLGAEDADAAQALLPLVRDSDPDTRRNAALALGNIGGPTGRAAAPVLRIALKDDETGIRRLASAALANIGPGAEEALPELIAIVADRTQDAIVRRNAALALTNLKEKSREAITVLIHAVQPGETEEVLLYVIEALGEIGEERSTLPQIEPAVPALLRILRQPETPALIRQRCVWLLGLFNLDRIDAVHAFEEVLTETDPGTRIVRYEAAVRLGIKLGPRANERTIDVLLAYLNDKEFKRYSGTEARVSSSGAEQSGGAAEVRQVGGGDHRLGPVMALGNMGRKANRPDVIQGLKAAERSDDLQVREAARDAVRQIQGRD